MATCTVSVAILGGGLRFGMAEFVGSANWIADARDSQADSSRTTYQPWQYTMYQRAENPPVEGIRRHIMKSEITSDTRRDSAAIRSACCAMADPLQCVATRHSQLEPYRLKPEER
ncbi:hypothetical protein ABFW11_04355 [Mycolicibacterium porcinum]|uniref:hypothetical protein n=1 Tax=Mycolicibacterium porcinum TaxID=39693 RepID=UPI0034CDD9F3